MLAKFIAAEILIETALLFAALLKADTSVHTHDHLGVLPMVARTDWSGCLLWRSGMSGYHYAASGRYPQYQNPTWLAFMAYGFRMRSDVPNRERERSPQLLDVTVCPDSVCCPVPLGEVVLIQPR